MLNWTICAAFCRLPVQTNSVQCLPRPFCRANNAISYKFEQDTYHLIYFLAGSTLDPISGCSFWILERTHLMASNQGPFGPLNHVSVPNGNVSGMPAEAAPSAAPSALPESRDAAYQPQASNRSKADHMSPCKPRPHVGIGGGHLSPQLFSSVQWRFKMQV